MKLYVSHSTGYDYTSELYKPIRDLLADDYDVFFPHGEDNNGTRTKDIIPTIDAVLAEVSYPSTGQGIELGWADTSGIPIICFSCNGARISNALRFVSSRFIEYESQEDMIERIRNEIESLQTD